MGRTLEGHDDIRAFWGPGVDQAYARPSTADVLSNIVADIDGDTARVESDWCMLAREEHGGTSIALAGRYRDRMQRVGASWRIAEREVVALGVAPLRRGPPTPSSTSIYDAPLRTSARPTRR